MSNKEKNKDRDSKGRFLSNHKHGFRKGYDPNRYNGGAVKGHRVTNRGVNPKVDRGSLNE